MRTEEDILKNLCQLFLHFMKYTKRQSPHSLRAYKTDLQALFNLEKTKEDSPLKKIPGLKIKEKKKLKESLQKQIEESTTKYFKLSHSSRNRKMATAKSFIKWLAEEDYIDEDFRHLFKSPKVPVRMPFFLSLEEITSILEMFKKEESLESRRDQTLFFLLYGGGLRVSEACHIKNQDIDWDNRTIKIQGKGGRERLVSLPEKSMQSLKYLKSNSKYLFGEKALSERKAYEIVKSIGRKAGILKPLHPHALRHSFATHMLLGGSDLRVLQELLGHKTLSSTQKYTHLDLAHLFQTLEKYHPLSKEKQSA